MEDTPGAVASGGDDDARSITGRTTRDKTLLWMRGVTAQFPGAPHAAFWAGVVASCGVIAEDMIVVYAPPQLLAMMQIYYGGAYAENTLTIQGADVCAMFHSQWDDAGGLFPTIPRDKTKVTVTHRLWAHGALLGRRCARDGIPGFRAWERPRVDVRLEQLRCLVPRLFGDMEKPPVRLPMDVQPAPAIDVAWELLPIWQAEREAASSERASQEAAERAAALRRLATPGPMALDALRERLRLRGERERAAKRAR